MPRIDKRLPPTRAECSFGDLVFWHFFVHGTRPDGNPAAKIGRVWDFKKVSGALGISERTLRYWIADKHLPDSIVMLERVLFGQSEVYDDWRLELAEALRRTRARNSAKALPTDSGSAARASSVPLNGLAESQDAEPEDADAGAIEIYAPPHHSFEDEPERNSRGEVIVPTPEIFYASRTQRRATGKWHAAIAVVGVTTLLGLYAWWSAPSKTIKPGTAVTAETPKAGLVSQLGDLFKTVTGGSLEEQKQLEEVRKNSAKFYDIFSAWLGSRGSPNFYKEREKTLRLLDVRDAYFARRKVSQSDPAKGATELTADEKKLLEAVRTIDLTAMFLADGAKGTLTVQQTQAFEQQSREQITEQFWSAKSIIAEMRDAYLNSAISTATLRVAVDEGLKAPLEKNTATLDAALNDMKNSSLMERAEILTRLSSSTQNSVLALRGVLLQDERRQPDKSQRDYEVLIAQLQQTVLKGKDFDEIRKTLITTYGDPDVRDHDMRGLIVFLTARKDLYVK